MYTNDKINPIKGINTEWLLGSKGHFEGCFVQLDLCQSHKYPEIKSKFNYFNFFTLFQDIEIQLLILQAILLEGTANVNHKHQCIALNMAPRTDF